MSKQLSYFLALMISMFLFCACTDNNDPNANKPPITDPDKPVALPIEKEMVGIYKGALNIFLNQAPFAQDVIQNINVTKANDNKIKISLKDLEIEGLKLGTIAIDSCEVLKADSIGGYTFTGSQELTLVVGKCDVKVTGTIIGSQIKSEIDVVARLGEADLNVKVNFTGTKLTGTESAESQITSLTFKNGSLITHAPVIDQDKGTITFFMADTTKLEEMTLTPTITISDKAIIKPASGVAQDFSEPIKYTVYAENGTQRVYTVSISGRSSLYSFEEWTGQENNMTASPSWANCNQAVALIKLFGQYATPPIVYTGILPIIPTEDSYKGKYAARLESIDTKGGNMMGATVPKVTAGSMFMGTFEAGNAMGDGGPMSTTSFGSMYDKEPMSVSGFYKYTPGKDFYVADGSISPLSQDTCSMTAVLYEVANEDETLDGNTIYTSNKIYAQAMFADHQEVSKYTKFDLKLKYNRPYDPTKLYKLAVIFSASKDGAHFNAAIGSVLLIDEVEIFSK